MSSKPITEEIARFCVCVVPAETDGAVFDGVIYAICGKCGLPIQDTGVPLDEEE